jgi:thioredoxin 1
MAIIEATAADFKKEVLESEQKVLVDFNAEWCGPCKMLAPILEEFAEENSDIKIVSVNIDDEAELAEEYEVSSIPCLVLFEGGKEVKRSVGLIPKAKLGKFVK